MSGLSFTEWMLVGLFIEGFFFGIYSAIFSIYVHYQISKKCANERTNILFYSLCILYVLTVAAIAVDVAQVVLEFLPTVEISTGQLFNITTFSSILMICCDILGQSILIYRCWIVWNRNIHVVIIPSILAFACLVLWLAGVGSEVYHTSPYRIVDPKWGSAVTTTSLAMSLTVNALVTALIVFKIVNVYWGVKPLYNQTLGPTDGSKLRPIIFILVESGMAFFSIQLGSLVLYLVPGTLAAISADQLFGSLLRIFIGITPTIIQVRVVTGLSFHDEKSMVDVASSLRFGSDHPNSSIQTGDDISVVWENGGDVIGAQPMNDADGIEVQRDEHISSPCILR